MRIGEDLGRLDQRGSQIARFIGERQAVDFRKDRIEFESRLPHHRRPRSLGNSQHVDGVAGQRVANNLRAAFFARSNRVSPSALVPMLKEASITITRWSGLWASCAA